MAEQIVPIIEKIVMTDDGVFAALAKDGNVLFVTQHQKVANMYYGVPEIVQRQASIIAQLQAELAELRTQQDQIILEAIPCGSAYFN